MKTYSRVKAVIDLDAIHYNFERMRENIKSGTKMIAVIKTDGYGHGAVPIARMLEDVDYIWGYAVATLEEGLGLRRAGMKKPVLCLGCIFPEEMETMVANEIRMTTYSTALARQASEAAVRLKKNVYFHIKLDTGMSRLGFQICEESIREIQEISKLPNVCMEGLFTHFSKSDEKDKTTSKQQIEAYDSIKRGLNALGIEFSYYHCSNSAGIIDLPDANMELVRAGIAAYGLYPSEDVNKAAVSLKPSLELIAHVTHVKWIEKGTSVSYGGIFTAPERMRIATIPVGYGDGYPRSLSNKGYVLIHGKKAPIVGRVCMDQFMVDVTGIESVEFGETVVLIGRSEGVNLPVEELSELSGRFNYEFVCDLNKRIPREYVMGGKVVEQIDYFN